MSLLFRILYAAHANGTHHKLALDALRFVEGLDAERWRRVILRHAELYLQGSKAPDKEFKDFQNHVLHVRDNHWGGAPDKAQKWYGNLVQALSAADWAEAAWCAGVLSHYYTDPLMPFHTAQSEAENNIHRAAEWSINKAYDEIWPAALARTDGLVIDTPPGANWVAAMVVNGASAANRDYEKLIAHYDITRGAREPADGLDPVSRRVVASHFAHATVGFGRMLTRAFAEGGVAPPDVTLTPQTVLAGLKIPLRWVQKKLSDSHDRAEVGAIYAELMATGTVETNLPEELRVVREWRMKDRAIAAMKTVRPGAAAQAREAETRPQQPHVPLPAPAASALDLQAALHDRFGGTPSTITEPVKKKNQQIPTGGGVSSENNPVPTGVSGPASTGTSVSAAGTGRDQSEKAEVEPVPAPHMDARDDAVVPPPHVRSARPASVAAERPATQAGRASNIRYFLSPSDSVVDAPSIGPKTAERLAKAGITTVEDLLNCDPIAAAKAIGSNFIVPKLILDWRDQARLACEVPELRAVAAQLLVGAGLRSRAELAQADAFDVFSSIVTFAQTPSGERVLRHGGVPSFEQVERWVARARDSEEEVAAVA